MLDRERKSEFKRYEMEKEHMRREKLEDLDEDTKKTEQEKHKQEQKKHKEHPKLHHPVGFQIGDGSLRKKKLQKRCNKKRVAEI